MEVATDTTEAAQSQDASVTLGNQGARGNTQDMSAVSPTLMHSTDSRKSPGGGDPKEDSAVAAVVSDVRVSSVCSSRPDESGVDAVGSSVDLADYESSVDLCVPNNTPASLETSYQPTPSLSHASAKSGVLETDLISRLAATAVGESGRAVGRAWPPAEIPKEDDADKRVNENKPAADSPVDGASAVPVAVEAGAEAGVGKDNTNMAKALELCINLTEVLKSLKSSVDKINGVLAQVRSSRKNSTASSKGGGKDNKHTGESEVEEADRGKKENGKNAEVPMEVSDSKESQGDANTKANDPAESKVNADNESKSETENGEIKLNGAEESVAKTETGESVKTEDGENEKVETEAKGNTEAAGVELNVNGASPSHGEPDSEGGGDEGRQEVEGDDDLETSPLETVLNGDGEEEVEIVNPPGVELPQGIPASSFH